MFQYCEHLDLELVASENEIICGTLLSIAGTIVSYYKRLTHLTLTLSSSIAPIKTYINVSIVALSVIKQCRDLQSLCILINTLIHQMKVLLKYFIIVKNWNHLIFVVLDSYPIIVLYYITIKTLYKITILKHKF